MKNTRKKVTKAAQLANIKLTDNEIIQISGYFEQMEKFVSGINKFQPIDEIDLDTYSYVCIDDLREDVPGRTINKKEALEKAKYHDSDYFIILKQDLNVKR